MSFMAALKGKGEDRQTARHTGRRSLIYGMVIRPHTFVSNSLIFHGEFETLFIGKIITHKGRNCDK